MVLSQFVKEWRGFLKNFPAIRQDIKEVNALMRDIDPWVVRLAWAGAVFEGLAALGAFAFAGFLWQRMLASYTTTGNLSQSTLMWGIVAITTYLIVKGVISNFSELRRGIFDDKLEYFLEQQEVKKILSLDLGRLSDPEFVALKEASKRKGTQAVANLFHTETSFISACVGVGAALGIILALDPILILLALVPVIPSTIKAAIIETKRRALWEKNHIVRRRKDEYEWSLSHKEHIVQAKLLRFVNHFWSRYTHFVTELRKSELFLKRFDFKADTGIGIIEALVGALAMAYVGRGVVRGSVSVTQVFLFLGSMQTFRRSLDALSHVSVRIGNLCRDYGYRKRFLETEPLINESRATDYHFASTPRLELRNVSFAYPRQEDRIALANCSFSIEPGEKVALVGRNGSGKTTALRLLTKTFLPSEGEVIVGQVPIERIRQECWLDHMLCVTQDSGLPDFRIDEAVCGALPEKVDIGRLEKACQLSGAAEFVRHLTLGYATQIGEDWPGGVGFSTGQMQRLKLAAAFYRLLDPTVYVALFDEPMAHCDVETRERFYRTISDIPDKTIVVIAHDPHNLHHFERVIVMEGGRVIRDLRGEQAIEEYRGSIATSLLTDL